MPKQDVSLSLKSYDDIFSTQAERDENAGSVEQVRQLKLSELVPFKNHPFKVKDDEDMEKTV
ncbi:MAG: chromosome partitioning protein ParB, partial [Clostridiales bacterium]|nr:chromosome partitioning protein ParB [Clostridiales bacterium]